MSERMTDERLEEIHAIIARQQAYLLQQGWSEKGFVGSPASELLAEVIRLRQKYEPTPPRHQPMLDGGQYDAHTNTFRVPLATWLRYGPFWLEHYPPDRVELTDREPRETTLASEGGGRAYWWLAHNIATPERLPREWFPVGDNGARFLTREEALAWASERAIAWAKAQSPS